MTAAEKRWLVSWHPADAEPAGRPHGAAGICVGNDGRDLVLISADEVHWGFPAGRPEGAETVRETLAREMREEACVEVLEARLLGFARSECVAGDEKGVVLVRSYWRAEVAIGPWEPQFEIAHRRIVPAAEAAAEVREPDPAAARISMRALAEAGLLNLKAIYRAYLAALNERRLDDLARYVHDELTYNGEPMTRDQYRDLIAADIAAVPDLTYDAHIVVAADDRVACRLVFTCTPQHEFLGFTPNGKRLSFAEHVFYDFREGRIAAVSSLIDRYAIQAQLGA